MGYNDGNDTFENMKNIVTNSLCLFYANENSLFDYADTHNFVSERCMVFHIGRYMLDDLHKIDEFKSFNLDVEYNRNFNHPKKTFKTTSKTIENRGQLAVPDVIIHKRKENDSNLLVLEFKKGNPTEKAKGIDDEKLKFFTSSDHEYKYAYGFYVELHKDKNATIKVYNKGNRVSHRDFNYSEGSVDE